MERKWDECIDSIVKKTGRPRMIVEAMAKYETKKYGISIIEYKANDFFKLSRTEKRKKAEDITEKREKKKEKRKKIEERHVKKVMKATGWTHDEAYASMKRSKKETGASFNHYVSYRFWEVDEAVQKLYFSKGTADALRKTYNQEEKIENIVIDKIRTFEEYGEYMGRKYLSTAEMSLDEFTECFGNEGKIIYKPLNKYGGKGIRVFEVPNENISAVYEELKGMDEGIIESLVVQHHEMQKLSVNAVNTVRIVTVMTNDSSIGIETGKVHFLYAGIRMGSGDSIVDNLHSKGVIAALDIDTGVVVTDGINIEGKAFKTHPDTGTVIKGFKVPYFQEAKDMVAEAGLKHAGYLGWDVAITENGPILIEINSNPGPTMIQIPYGILEKKGVRYMVEDYLKKEDR